MALLHCGAWERKGSRCEIYAQCRHIDHHYPTPDHLSCFTQHVCIVGRRCSLCHFSPPYLPAADITSQTQTFAVSSWSEATSAYRQYPGSTQSISLARLCRLGKDLWRHCSHPSARTTFRHTQLCQGGERLIGTEICDIFRQAKNAYVDGVVSPVHVQRQKLTEPVLEWAGRGILR